MDTAHIIDFCSGWLSKADTYDNTSLNGVFDRYFTLFVTYNALYNHVTRQLAESGKLSKKQHGDKNSATQNMVTFYGADNLYDIIQGREECLRSIVSRLKHNGFYLHSKKSDGSPDYERDDILKKDICSTRKQASALATLVLLYQLRCNLFHGEKEYHMNQIDILGPANILLHMIVCAFIDKLKESA